MAAVAGSSAVISSIKDIATAPYHYSIQAAPRRIPTTIPSQPPDCVQLARILPWPRAIDGNKRDRDDPELLLGIYRQALQGVQGVNISSAARSQTTCVVERIMPATASVNTIIPTSCCNKALAIARAPIHT
ncbi:hypothetical protein HOY80DRAFT_1134921 [Tuber brumale]|nr:hypothetical protein HOY80DRAFT_1134921 [Tuber brumale]